MAKGKPKGDDPQSSGTPRGSPSPGDPVEIFDGPHKGKTGHLLRYRTLPSSDHEAPLWAFVTLDESGKTVRVQANAVRTRIQTAGSPLGGVVGGSNTSTVPPFRGGGTDASDAAIAAGRAQRRGAAARMASGTVSPPPGLPPTEQSIQGAAAVAAAGTVRVGVKNYTGPPGWEAQQPAILERLAAFQRTADQVEQHLADIKRRQPGASLGHNSQASDVEIDALRNTVAAAKASSESIEHGVRRDEPTSPGVKSGAMALKLLVAGGIIGIGQSLGRSVADAAQKVFGADPALQALFESLVVHATEIVMWVERLFQSSGAPIWPG